jgi:DNA-binding NarL/FixJ family response regulator
MSVARVLLVEDHVVLREGLKALFGGEPDVEIVGEADNGRDALNRAAELRPNVVLMDLSMPGLNGLETTRRMRHQFPEIKVVVLSMHSHEEYVFQALRAGASGYVLKQANSIELLAAIRAALCGGSFLSSSISRTVIDGYVSRAEARGRGKEVDRLTSREREVLQLLVEGVPNRAIAKLLGISVKTVESHRSNMMTKLGLSNKTELVRYALDKGWTSLDQPRRYS